MRVLFLCFILAVLLSACGVQAEPAEFSDGVLPNGKDNEKDKMFSTETFTSPTPSLPSEPSPEPLVYTLPTRTNIPVERLPDYEPETEVLIAAGSRDPRFIGDKQPRLVNRNGEKVTLPAGVQACSVDGIACCGDYMDERPSALFLMIGNTYAVMRLDGEIVTGFDYCMQYECDIPYWCTYKGYLACLKVSENGETTGCLLDIRTGEEIISDCQMEWDFYSAISVYDGVVKAYQNGMYRLYDYNGNLLYESEKEIRVIEYENGIDIEHGGEVFLYLQRGEIVESNLPVGTNACKVGEYTVLRSNADVSGNVLTVLDHNHQPIHTQWYDELVCYIDGGGLIAAVDSHFTAIIPATELVLFELPDHVNGRYRYNAFLSDDSLLTLEREEPSRYSRDRTRFTIEAAAITESGITLPDYEAEYEISQLSPHVIGLMDLGYPETCAMIDEAGQILIDFGKYQKLEEKGGFVLAYTEYDYDLGWQLFDIYNNEGRLLRSGAIAERRLVMQECMVVYRSGTGTPSLLYFDGRLKRIS